MIERHGRTPIMHRIVEHNGVLYVGGMVADDRSVGMQGQVEQILHKLAGLLTPLGSGKEKVLAATIYVTDLAQKAGLNAAWTAFFGDSLPTRATIGVADLGSADTLVEIVFTASR
jgi:enamine deaminase RidA (YjgF/YER057c/UK114 family)